MSVVSAGATVITASESLLLKLASIAGYAEELFSDAGREADKQAIVRLLHDPEVRSFLDAPKDARIPATAEAAMNHELRSEIGKQTEVIIQHCYSDNSPIEIRNRVTGVLLRAHYEAKAEAMEEARSMCPEFVPLQYDPWFEIDCLAVKYRALAKGVKE